MPGPNFKKAALIAIILFACQFANAQAVSTPENTPSEWSAPYQPFRIAGNLYYVGTYDLACYLITTSEGNILINTGLAASADRINKNIETLGFKPTDTRILLTTQAHFDHMAGMAAIQRLTGAKMMVNRGDSSVVADGGKSDYALLSTFEPVKIDRVLNNRDTIKLGAARLVMLNHPGHTKGSCSFLFDVRDKQRSYRVLIANMPTIVTEKKFSEVPTYKQIASDYAYTLREMKKLSFDIWLASHASQFNLHKKHKPGDKYNPSVFIDKAGYDAALKDLQRQFSNKIKKN
ncbi:subclass B3 metallo-beta-lactamase [Pedobacter ginsengisoli]|uniref:Subclass B3 metallo-beta-lactamase n=1 Tax=Pedobacter ginsengisoli TaxID=363852 RepID=A0A2D1U4J3_9SPHI|nr:subclass B3 metallo-beta-lactamase [Pedobacter ginsengisoli]ATP56533.1 subclass B3 metallo-beta-lactamase [Pedobacter ginsengisoli]